MEYAFFRFALDAACDLYKDFPDAGSAPFIQSMELSLNGRQYVVAKITTDKIGEQFAAVVSTATGRTVVRYLPEGESFNDFICDVMTSED